MVKLQHVFMTTYKNDFTDVPPFLAIKLQKNAESQPISNDQNDQCDIEQTEKPRTGKAKMKKHQYADRKQNKGNHVAEHSNHDLFRPNHRTVENHSGMKVAQ